MNPNDELVSILSRMALMMENQMIQEFYTVSEASELLRCSKATIRRMINDNRLPFSRLKGSVKSKIVIHRRDLLQSIDGANHV
jgi:excisionase family DNA binding protein